MWKDFEKQYSLVHSDIILSDVKGSSPFEDVVIVKCKNCNTSLLAQAFSSHFQACRTIATLPDKAPAKKSISSLKKKEKKKLDLDRHCGVALENGEHCVRSLKCKNHTLNMKRQVSGRSNVFDVLFNDSSKNSSKSAPMPVISTSPDKEVAGILKSLEGFVPLPLVVYHEPCILELTKRKNELILSEIVRAK